MFNLLEIGTCLKGFVEIRKIPEVIGIWVVGNGVTPGQSAIAYNFKRVFLETVFSKSVRPVSPKFIIRFDWNFFILKNILLAGRRGGGGQ